ncbi:histidine phosphatase family protein [Clostridium sp. D2Q-14]|uniref:histidine phosphatase family protein n=1 Tax=Anaeromonas gelatinilytica TaxID=2683194 RepID=UPI00193AE380|nr:histidine phosphatase family protein [Anaeromonas gelatinilytica]MBS4536152.1 histidine phosphatase family protein [Anaeromonas gelatinilytica]
MNENLLNLLRRGGYILYARHGEATIGVDQPNLNFWDCSTQRNLSEFGRKQSIYYGEMLCYLEIPIGYPIIASPFCRTIETAQLAFGRENIEIDPFWVEVYSLSGNISDVERNRILELFQLKLEIKPCKGTNNIIIDHSFPQGIGLGQISNMGTVIVKPKGEGRGYEIISKLKLEDLANLE